MIGFRGRLSFKQYMPAEPTKYRIKRQWWEKKIRKELEFRRELMHGFITGFSSVMHKKSKKGSKIQKNTLTIENAKGHPIQKIDGRKNLSTARKSGKRHQKDRRWRQITSEPNALSCCAGMDASSTTTPSNKTTSPMS
ncbi:uncharacterized protein LOC116615450 [Nematostella vectensis]|uniref:uncharacterized protein LOC116615450 n=1 Tax=Nematostella vectensis TaxID=45351 RepID=UPI002076E926|nr:uncharacterized protein LOC116615450 [Nematostella vectensis]